MHEAEDLLIADFFTWDHVSGVHDISCEEYHVPAHVQEYIDYVTPGTRLRQKNYKRNGVKAARSEGLHKRLVAEPLITELPGFPNPNASNCDVFVTAPCTRGTYFYRITRWLNLTALCFSPIRNSQWNNGCPWE